MTVSFNRKMKQNVADHKHWQIVQIEFRRFPNCRWTAINRSISGNAGVCGSYLSVYRDGLSDGAVEASSWWVRESSLLLQTAVATNRCRRAKQEFELHSAFELGTWTYIYYATLRDVGAGGVEARRNECRQSTFCWSAKIWNCWHNRVSIEDCQSR